MARPIMSHEVLDFNITLTASNTEQFQSILTNTDSSEFGLQLRNVMAQSKYGVSFITTPGSETTLMHVGLITGFFKWPASAALPTQATIDLEESGKVIDRRLGSAIGTFPGVVNNRVGRLNLKPGERLFHFVRFVRQSSTTADLTGIIMVKFETTRL